jgi:hypothetical protein
MVSDRDIALFTLTRFSDRTIFLRRGLPSRFFGEHIVSNSLTTWLGEVTTGHGVMIIGGTLLSVLTGAVSWAGAAPLLAAGFVGLIWPENTALQTAAQQVATDAEGAMTAYTQAKKPPPLA